MEWVEKYKPNKLTQCYNKKIVNSLIDWMNNWNENNDLIKNSLILTGKSGVGKSLYANLVLQHFNFTQVFECNANDVRTYKSLSKILDISISSKSIYSMTDRKSDKKTAIIMDEIEGLSLGDRGCMKKILELIYIKSKKKSNKLIKSKVPVINICNTIDNSKLSSIKKYSKIIYIKEPEKQELIELGNKIIDNEGEFITKDFLEYLVQQKPFDYRSFIFLLKELHYLHFKKTDITPTFLEELLSKSYEKQQDLDMYQVTKYIIKSEEINKQYLLDSYKTFQSVLPYVVYDNFNTTILNPKNIKKFKKLKDFKQLRQYYEDISISNIFEKCIYDDQKWELSDYSGLLFFYRANLINKKHDLVLKPFSYSKLLNKNSKILYNHKLTKNVMNKMDLENFDISLLGSYYLKILTSKSSDKKENIIKDLRQKEVVQSDIDKFVKFNLYSKDLSKVYTNQQKRKIKYYLENKNPKFNS